MPFMNFSFLKNPITRFLLTILSFYLIWYLVYDLWLHPAEKLDLFVIDITVAASKWLLELFGYLVFTGSDRLIGVDGTSGLWIGDNCNGIALFAQFAGFIIAYPGNWIKKLFFIPLGIIIIELLNILRVVGLAILDTYSRTWTEFNHTYTFSIVIYGVIFLLWMLWVNKISDKTLSVKKA
jgi:exosortase family protein XrtF